ncbi:MAG: immunity 22 family protein [Campylobacteraceae bacterium]|nr:immunity 22 family protein [Campylobacteraceae bacterium]
MENTPESALYDNMYKACIDKNINQANAMFYYTGDDIESLDEDKKYNDLTFIGVFEWK